MIKQSKFQLDAGHDQINKKLCIYFVISQFSGGSISDLLYHNNNDY